MALTIQNTCFGDESEFYKQLDASGKKRYREKTALLGLCYDPDTTSRDCWERTPNVWPDVEFPDICAYLIHTPSPYTKEALKAYKSTDRSVVLLLRWLCTRCKSVKNFFF